MNYKEINNWTVYIHTVPSHISGYLWDKHYVGITSQRPKDRWGRGRGYKQNEHFNRAIQKYGWDNIEHTIVAEHLSCKEACDMEVSLIQELNALNPDYGYNISQGGFTPHWTDEQKKRQSEKYTGENNPYYNKRHSDETKKLISLHHYDCSYGNNSFAKRVYQFTIDGEFIAEYDSCSFAGVSTGIHNGTISHAARYNKTAGGFLWVYSDNVEKTENGYKIKEYKYIPKRLTNKTVYQFDMNGKFIAKYESCVQAGICNGLSKDSVSSAARYRSNGQRNTKFLWRYQDDVAESEYNDGSFIMLR